MFVDKAVVEIQAGDGGDGIVSFRQEKFVDHGGPDGGDGGDGGDVVLVASRNENTLANFRYQKLLKAPPGKPGFSVRKHGRSGEDLLVSVPVGTVVMSEDGKLLADLKHDEEQTVIARGGKGGFGNAHFTSSTRQAPRVAEKGEKGDALTVVLELKMIADVGLVGLPNAGKSTLLSSISNAHPEIANYPFTTLRPNLGVVQVDKETSLLFADIPGLIEGASEGKGLGDEFLRHVERTKVLVHLIDAYADNVAEAYTTIQGELAAYKIDLSSKPQLVTLNKIDGLDQEIIDDKISELQKVVPKNTSIYAISAQSKQNVQQLLYAIKEVVATVVPVEEEESDALPVLTLKNTDQSWKIEKTEKGFIVKGRKIEKFAEKTDFNSTHAIQRLRDIMRKMGIMHALERQSINPGDTISINGRGSIEY